MSCDNQECNVEVTVPLNASRSALNEAKAVLEQKLGPGNIFTNGHAAEFVVRCTGPENCLKARAANVNKQTVGEVDGVVVLSEECPIVLMAAIEAETLKALGEYH